MIDFINNHNDAFVILATIVIVIVAIISTIISNRKNEYKNIFNNKHTYEKINQENYQQPAQYQNHESYQPPIQYQNRMPYIKKNLLTQNEYRFYRLLKPTADKYNLQILTKIRLADLIEVMPGTDRRTWGFYFGKIKAKHIDFVIVDEMKVVLLIELDDSTHQAPDRRERDRFVNDAVWTAGYKILHTYGNIEYIEKAMQDYKGIKQEVNEVFTQNI